MKNRQEVGSFKEVAFFIIAVLWIFYQLATTFFGYLPTMQQGSIHLGFALILLYIIKINPIKNKNMVSRTFLTIGQGTFITLSIIVCAYPAVNYFELLFNAGSWNIWEIYISAVALILIIDATWREMGWPLPVITILFLLYAYFGPYLPGHVGHVGFPIERILGYLYLTIEGVFGVALAVSSTFIFMFLLFSAVLRELGGGKFITDMATALFGYVRGGPAKMAVVSSALFGMVSGSGVANVATTGTFTIPLMKKTGYKPHIAGAVEAVASVGGQIMPPVMGAAAFIMAEILEIPYYYVCFAAAVPACLYYLGLFVAVDLEAVKTGIKGVPKEELPHGKEILKKGWIFLIPPAVLVYLLVVPQYSPGRCCFWAIVVNVGLCLIRSKFSKNEFKTIFISFQQCAKGAIVLSVCCACVGLIIGTTTMTGLGLKLSGMLIELSGGNLFVLLLLTMIVNLILGTSLPTVAVYLVLAVMIAPALITLGVHPLAAHLFIFYYGILSQITPPMALASYVAAGIAEADFLKTGFAAIRLSIISFILPFLFVYSPVLLLQGSILEILEALATATVGLIAFVIGVEGYFLSKLPLLKRIIMIAGGLLLVKPGLITDVIGVILILIVISTDFLKRKNQKKT